MRVAGWTGHSPWCDDRDGGASFDGCDPGFRL
jgi:hypothetical protein